MNQRAKNKVFLGVWVDRDLDAQVRYIGRRLGLSRSAVVTRILEGETKRIVMLPVLERMPWENERFG